MTSPLSCFCSFNALKAYTGILGTTAAITYLAHGVTDQTVVPLVRIFTKYCTQGALGNTTVQSPIGEITCDSLAKVISYEEGLSSTLTWVMPLIVGAACGLGVYIAIKTDCCNRCNRLPRRYAPLNTNPPAEDV